MLDRSAIRAEKEDIGRDLFDGKGAIDGCLVAERKRTDREALVEEKYGLRKVSINCRKDVVLDRTMRDEDELVLDGDFEIGGHSARTSKAASERTIEEATSVHMYGLSQGWSCAAGKCRSGLSMRVEREKGLQGELDASNERKKSLLMSHNTRESEHDDHREQRRHEGKQDRLHWTVETFRMNYDTC